MAPSSTDMVYQLHVQLLDTEPMIWRRITVSGSVNLYRLHLHLQIVMNWENYHLHQFLVGTTYYGIPDPEMDIEIKDERRVKHRNVAQKVGTSSHTSMTSAIAGVISWSWRRSSL